ncbi:MAG: hypothetical protein IV107_16440 [Paucibacter sp.]|nr:hypothetical protein [Roseateles sp.]
MQFNFEIDIKSIVAAAVAPDRIQPLLDKAITEALKSAISDATGYRSEFQTKLKAQLSEALPHGLGVDDVAKFQFIMNRAVTAAVQGANSDALQTAMRDVVKSVMPDVPATIQLSELMELTRDGFHKEKHEAFYARLELSNSGGGWLYLDSDEGCSSHYSATTRLSFNAAGEVYALRMDSKDLTPLGLPQAITRFEGLLLALYVGRSRLEVDIDERDVESVCQSNHD